MAHEKFRHIFLKDPPSTKSFTSISSVVPKKFIPDRDRQIHSKFLFERLNKAWQEAENDQAVFHSTREGVYIEFKSDPGAELVTKSLDDLRSKKVRLLNVRTEKEDDKDVTYATVYVANEKKNHFLKKIQEYAQKDLKTGKPKNASLINSIADIRKALVESFWQDAKELIPSKEKAWCEVWLSSDSAEVVQGFENLLKSEEIDSANGSIKFPERAVKLILADKKQLEQLTMLSSDIAEYRRGKETSAFWIEMENQEQAEWVRELLKRCQVEQNSKIVVCVLDTGINNGHPLLSKILSNEDCQTVDPKWGIDDHNGHGTLMAGLVGYGDLRECLSSVELIQLRHCLESVKILPPGNKQTDKELWGFVTDQAVSRAEIQSPDKKRILCMAITATDSRDRGRPSSWSGKLDQISFGADRVNKRLFVVCGGNVDLNTVLEYPNAQLTDSIHDPAQSWNSLAVGAYTELVEVKNKTFDGFSPVAPAGGLSPFSTTSLNWDNKWPIKPEIVMEGGNVIHDGKKSHAYPSDVSLLSTYRDPAVRYFFDFNMTSAATAQAAWFAAQIYNAYPDIWPETIRALMVHSAEWTETLKKQFLQKNTKTEYSKLLRICGYGVPKLERALYSASNNLTLIAQEKLQPFDKKAGESGYKTKEMHLYDLPWPKEVLQGLPDQTKVQMRVTLSYFIEPGPGEIGWRDRYRYASHALRFDVKSPSETNELFEKRINAAARSEDEGAPGTQGVSDHWTIGSTGRDKGSIHSDIWNGTTKELAESGTIAVFPVIGWWRERAYLGKWASESRYALIVSITTPEEAVDIYTPIANKIGIAVSVRV